MFGEVLTMKLIRAEISGFGHYRQRDFDFSAGNQLFYGENETGKSTLYHFIQTMLFGFAKKSNKKRDYTPNDGAAFGGRLWIEHPIYGEIQIDRFRQINRGKAKIQVGEVEGDEAWLLELLAPLTLETFQDVFTFQQEQLSELDRLQEKELHDALISLGISGSAQVMNQIQQYEKTNQQMYKLKGQKLPLNQKLNEWQKLKEIIQQKEQQETQVQQAYQKMAYYQAQAEKSHLQAQELQQRSQLLEQQQLNWPLYEEWRELSGVQEPLVSEEKTRKLQQFHQRYQQLSEEIQKKEAELAQLESGQTSDRYFFYLDQEANIQQILREKVSMIRLLDESQRLTVEIQQVRQELAVLQQKRGWRQVPEKSNPNIPSRIQQLKEEEGQLAEETLRFTWINEQLAQLETEIETLEKKSPQLFSTSELKKYLSYVLLAGGFVGFLAGFLLTGMIQVLLFILGVSGVLAGGYLQIQQNKAQQSKPLWQEKMQKKSELTENRSQQEQKITQLQQKVSEKKQQLQPLFGQETETSKWLQMVSEYNYEIDTFEGYLHQLAELKPKEIALNQQLATYLELFNDFNDWLPLENKNLSEKISRLEDFQIEMQAIKMERLQQPSTLLAQQLRRQKQSREELFVTYEGLLAEFGLTHPTEIPLWSKQWQLQEKQLARKKELSELLQPLFPKRLSKKELAEEKARVKEQQNELHATLSLDLEEKQRLQLQLEQLQEDGTLDQLYQQEMELKTAIEEGMILWGKNRLLRTFLTDLATELSEQQLPQLLQQASYYFELLTNQEYYQVQLEEGILSVLSANGTQPIYQLSTGTKDQLIMALRFAYLALQRGKVLSPVIIDDGWLHYDGKRKQQLARLLAEFGKDYQIICLSSDQEMVSYYQELNQAVKIMI